MPVRIAPALLVLALGLTCGLVAVAVLSDGSPSAVGAPAAAGRASIREPIDARPRALSVLHDWDRRRAAAWAAGDVAALRALYLPSSSAAHADVGLLRRYLSRGLRVEGMRMQVLRARVLASTPTVVEVEVTDRLAAGVAVRVDDPRVARRLPADGASTHVVRLRRLQGRWLVARVSAAGG